MNPMPAELLILFDDFMMQHDPGPGHPERPARLRAIGEMLDSLPVRGIEREKPPAALRRHLERVHDNKHIDFIDSLRGRSARLDADTAVSAASVDAAYLAAGAAVEMVEALASRRATRVFALVRPPGHHAECDRAMGFCLFNNVAVAAAHAIDQLGCQRVLIVDWDVHHGNGTQHMFENRRDVLYFSSHQWPLYPGTGALNEHGTGAGTGFTVNAPLPAGADDSLYVGLYRQLLAPIADAYKPDLVLVSAGFDAHRDDPLAAMHMTEAGFAVLCALMSDIADRHASDRLGLILEGGYSLSALANSAKACVESLTGAAPPQALPPNAAAQRVIDEICSAHRRFWPI